MTIQELGSIGELIGAVAVLVTVVYLALQTRLSRKAAEQTAMFASQEATRAAPEMYALYRSLVAKPELAELIVKARTEELTQTEMLMYKTVFEELIYAAVTSYQSTLLSASAHSGVADIEHLLGILRDNPKAVDVWHQNRNIAMQMSQPFVEAIDCVLECDAK